MERRQLRHLAVFAASVGSVPHLFTTRGGHRSVQGKRVLQGQPGLGLDQIDEAADAQVLVEFFSFGRADAAIIVAITVMPLSVVLALHPGKTPPLTYFAKI